MIVISIVATIVSQIVVAIATAVTDNPDEVGDGDERDKAIERLGEYRGGIFGSALMLGPLVLAMLEMDHFWIANGIYTAFAVQSLTAGVFKVMAYRRGF